MQTFKDAEGREWIVELHVRAIREIKARTGVNLSELMALDFDSANSVSEALMDTMTVADMLWVVCESQRTISKEDFESAIKGDVVEAAESALMESVIEWFPKRKREVLRKLTSLPEKVVQQMVEFMENQAAEEEVAGATEETEEATKTDTTQESTEQLGTQSTTMQESVASIPTP